MGNCNEKYDIPPHVKFIHLKNFGIDYDQIVRFNPDTGQMMRLAHRSINAKFQSWQLIDTTNDRIVELKQHPTIKNPRNYIIFPDSTDIKIPKTQRFRPDGAYFHGDYLCGYKRNKWKTFVPIHQLLQSIAQNKSYKTDTTKNIDVSGVSTHQHHFHFSDDQFLSMNIDTDTKYIQCNIYSLKTNNLINSIQNIFKLPLEIVGKMNQLREAKINNYGCLSFTFYRKDNEDELDNDIFQYTYNQKGDFQKHRLHRHIFFFEKIQPSKQLAAYKRIDKYIQYLFIYKFNDKYEYLYDMKNMETMDVLNKWKVKNRLTKIEWFDDDTLIAYDNKYLYIFMNALKNKIKHEILLTYLGMSDLVNIILYMIGFELFGAWLCHNHQFGSCYEKNQKCDDITFDFYFGKYKSYAVINKLKERTKTIKKYSFSKHTLRTILVDLNHKYAAKNVVEAIEMTDPQK